MKHTVLLVADSKLENCYLGQCRESAVVINQQIDDFVLSQDFCSPLSNRCLLRVRHYVDDWG